MQTQRAAAHRGYTECVGLVSNCLLVVLQERGTGGLWEQTKVLVRAREACIAE